MPPIRETRRQGLAAINGEALRSFNRGFEEADSSSQDATLRAVLRAGAYELKTRTDVPARVVITEYVDVANAFFEGEVPAMVNGVLDTLGRRLRAGEFPAERPAK